MVQDSQQFDEAIKRILTNDLGVSADMVAQCARSTPLLGRGIGLDSVEAMSLILSIEQEFDIQVPDTDLTVALFQSISTLSDYISAKLISKQDLL